MEIGGFFPYQPVGSEPNNYVEHTCPDPGDTAHLMSGRCAIYYCLRDLILTDQKRVAYLPSYDCETVLGCFVKAGYEIHYYDFDKKSFPLCFEEEMIPQISVLPCLWILWVILPMMRTLSKNVKPVAFL